VDRNTLVVFTSDNGPWTIFGDHGGTAGLLRGDKGSTWEGGNRVPALFWWPGTIVPGVVRELGAGVDLFVTALSLAGTGLPADRPIDGVDLSPVLRGAGGSPRDLMPFFRGTTVWAIRDARYKMHLATQPGFGLDAQRVTHEPPLLFDLLQDPGELRDIASEHPEVLASLRERLQSFEQQLTHGPDQLFEQLPAL
jgi:arylsulfatase A-like enzyme